MNLHPDVLLNKMKSKFDKTNFDLNKINFFHINQHMKKMRCLTWINSLIELIEKNKYPTKILNELTIYI